MENWVRNAELCGTHDTPGRNLKTKQKLMDDERDGRSNNCGN